jgi:hypothetical protein
MSCHITETHFETLTDLIISRGDEDDLEIPKEVAHIICDHVYKYRPPVLFRLCQRQLRLQKDIDDFGIAFLNPKFPIPTVKELDEALHRRTCTHNSHIWKPLNCSIARPQIWFERAYEGVCSDIKHNWMLNAGELDPFDVWSLSDNVRARSGKKSPGILIDLNVTKTAHKYCDDPECMKAFTDLINAKERNYADLIVFILMHAKMRCNLDGMSF